MNPRRTPEHVFTAQGTNQGADFLRHLRPPRSATPNFPAPEQAKAFAVPADNGGGLDEEDTGPPIVPYGTEPSPQESIRRGEFRTLDGALQNSELMAQRQDFQ